MKVYRKRSSGFIEELNTVGSYCPPGWSKTRNGAERQNGNIHNGEYVNSKSHAGNEPNSGLAYATLKAHRAAINDFYAGLEPNPARHSARPNSAFATWYEKKFNELKNFAL